MKDYRPEPRLVIEVSGGLVTRVMADNVPALVAMGVTVIVLDYDTDGAEEGDGLIETQDAGPCFVKPMDLEMADDDDHLQYGQLHQAWAITP